VHYYFLVIKGEQISWLAIRSAFALASATTTTTTTSTTTTTTTTTTYI
jgi:hypothetical protein